MARLEYKYYFPLQYLDDLRRDILPFLKHDVFMENSIKKEYTVRSIYLDTPQLLTYNEKLAGVKIRNKFRVRGYNLQSENSVVFLEIKRKVVDHISKDRAPLLYNELDGFLKTKNMDLILSLNEDIIKRKTSAQNFLYYYFMHNLQPYVVVTYEREAFECKFGSGLRITFDKNVRTRTAKDFSNLFSDANMVPSMKNNFVLEVKFQKYLPSWLPAVMRKYNISRGSVPKYSLSVEAIDKNKISKIMN